jgi:hypothetical protein
MVEEEHIFMEEKISSFHFSQFLKSMGENTANYHSFPEDTPQKIVVCYKNIIYTFLENAKDASIQIIVETPQKKDIYFSWDAFLKKRDSYFLQSHPLNFIC